MFYNSFCWVDISLTNVSCIFSTPVDFVSSLLSLRHIDSMNVIYYFSSKTDVHKEVFVGLIFLESITSHCQL